MAVAPAEAIPAVTVNPPERENGRSKLVRISKHGAAVVLGLADVVSDFLFYFNLRAGYDMDGYAKTYLAFLVLSILLFIMEVLTFIYNIYQAWKLEKIEINACYSVMINALGILLEDIPFSIIILDAILRSRNCGFVVSLTYSKNALITSIFTFIGSLVKSTLFIDKIIILGGFADADNYIEKFSIVFAIYIFFPLLVMCMVFFGVYCIFEGGYTVEQQQQVQDPQQEQARRQELRKNLITAIVFCPTFLFFLPLYITCFNMLCLTDLDKLASYSGCTLFTISIYGFASYPFSNASVCGAMQLSPGQYVMLNDVIETVSGTLTLQSNKIVLSGQCENLLPMEFSGIYMASPVDNFTKNAAYSACVKPFLTAPNGFSSPWMLSETVERVGKSYCNSTWNETFNACSQRDSSAISSSGLPCYDCHNRCYKWIALSKSSQIIFYGFNGTMVANGRVSYLRQNYKIATHCDVDSDLKTERYFCTPI